MSAEEISRATNIPINPIRRVVRSSAPHPHTARGPLVMNEKTLRAAFDLMDGVPIPDVAKSHGLDYIRVARIRRLLMEVA